MIIISFQWIFISFRSEKSFTDWHTNWRQIQIWTKKKTNSSIWVVYYLDELIFSPLFVLTFTFAWQCNLQGAKEDWPFRNWKWKCTLWSTSQTFRNNIEENIQDSNNQEDFLQRNASAKNDILWICRRIKSFQNRLWIFCALICEYIEQRKLVF